MSAAPIDTTTAPEAPRHPARGLLARYAPVF